MVLLLLTPALETRLQPLLPLLPQELLQLVQFHLDQPQESIDSTSSPLPQITEKGEQVKTIEHNVLVQVSNWVKGEEEEGLRGELESLGGKDQFRLSYLLKLTDIYAPPLKPRTKSPELLAILSSIQLSQDRISYASLTSLQTPSHISLLPQTDIHASSSSKTVAEEWGEIKRELSAIVNVLVSMGAVFTSVYWVGFGYSPAVRLGLSMGGAIAIAMIEGWLYWRVFGRVEEGKKEKERWRNEGKTTSGKMGKVLKFE